MTRLHPDFSYPGKQPQGPVVIDWNNPLTRGLQWAQIGEDIFDHTGRHRRYQEINYATTGFKASQGARVLSSENWGANDVASFRSGRAHRNIKNTNKFSIVIRYNLTTLTQASYAQIFQVRGTQNWANYYSPYGLRRRAGGNTFEVYIGTNTSIELLNIAGGPAFSTLDRRTLAFTRNGTSHTAYENGKFSVNVTGTSSAGYPNADAAYPDIYLLSRHDNTTRGLAEVEHTAIWDRELSAEEVKALSDDFYQIFKPEIVPALIVPAGGIVAQLNAGAISLAGASILGRITAAMAAGGYSLSGGDMAMLRQALLSGGSVSLYGADTTASRVGALGGGSHALAGGDIVGRIEAALSSGSIALSGGDLALSIVRALFAGNISQADLVSDGRNSLTLVDDGQNEAGSS